MKLTSIAALAQLLVRERASRVNFILLYACVYSILII